MQSSINSFGPADAASEDTLRRGMGVFSGCLLLLQAAGAVGRGLGQPDVDLNSGPLSPGWVTSDKVPDPAEAQFSHL